MLLNCVVLVSIHHRVSCMALSVLPDPNSQRDDVRFLGILKNDGDGPSGAGGSSKSYPEVPIFHSGFMIFATSLL